MVRQNTMASRASLFPRQKIMGLFEIYQRFVSCRNAVYNESFWQFFLALQNTNLLLDNKVQSYHHYLAITEAN